MQATPEDLNKSSTKMIGPKVTTHFEPGKIVIESAFADIPLVLSLPAEYLRRALGLYDKWMELQQDIKQVQE